MQKVWGHLHSDSTPSWPTDHVARKGREMRHRCSPVLHAMMQSQRMGSLSAGRDGRDDGNVGTHFY